MQTRQLVPMPRWNVRGLVAATSLLQNPSLVQQWDPRRDAMGVSTRVSPQVDKFSHVLTWGAFIVAATGSSRWLGSIGTKSARREQGEDQLKPHCRRERRYVNMACFNDPKEGRNWRRESKKKLKLGSGPNHVLESVAAYPRALPLVNGADLSRRRSRTT